MNENNSLGPRGPILGDDECKHINLTYYNSGYSGIYAMCNNCKGHFWDATPPQGTKIVNLND